jgi:undecaprenyl-diphosphatase
MGLHDFSDNAYAIVIQGGAVLAVLGLYRKRVREMWLGILGKHAAGLKLAMNLFIALLPAVILGILFDEIIEEKLMHPRPIALALILGGILMLFVSRWQRNAYHEGGHGKQFIDIEHLTWKHALFIGLLQCIAMWPGTSRSMMTIVGGMAVGLKPKHAAEFSFLLALPTLGGATLYKLFQTSDQLSDDLGIGTVILGILVAFIVAAISIKWLVSYLSKHGLALFGWYRIAFAIVVLVLWYNGYFGEGNNDSSTEDGGSAISSAPPTVTLKIDHCPALPVAIQERPSTITGPTTDCQFPVLIS